MKHLIILLFMPLVLITKAQSTRDNGMPITIYYQDEYGRKTDQILAKGFTTLDPEEVNAELQADPYEPYLVINEGKTGKWTFYDDQGKLYFEGNFNKNEQVGTWMYYYPSGKVKEHIEYDDQGFKNGSDKVYAESGQIMIDSRFKKDIPVGIWKTNDLFGIPVATIDYDHGIYTRFNNEKTNLVVQFGYTADGQLKLKQYKSFYENGNPHLEGTFDENMPISLDSEKKTYIAKFSGVWKTYWETGELATENNFDINTLNAINTKYTDYYPYSNEGGAYGKGNKVLTEINLINKADGVWGTLKGITDLTVKSNEEVRNQEGLKLKTGPKTRTIFSLDAPFELTLSKGAFRRTGLWEYWDKYKFLISKIEYSIITNSPAGKAEFYYSNGKLKSTGSYNANGKLDGLWKYYAENGNLTEARNYSNGKMNGMDIDYFINGTIKDKAIYVDDKIANELEFYYPNGKPLGKEYYTNGTFTGYGNFFDENGNAIYQNGEGHVIYYYENTQVSSKINLLGDKRQGLCTWYYDNGNLKEQSNYNNGQLSGNYQFYFQNGGIKEKGNRINGKTEGMVEYYFPNGKLLGRVKFANNNILSPEVFYDETGKTILSNGSGTFISLNNLGTVEFKCNYLNNCRDGKAEWYYENGQLSQAAIYKYSDADKPFGLRWEVLEVNDKNGNPMDKGTLKDGNGTWISYDDQGKATVNEYVNGRIK